MMYVDVLSELTIPFKTICFMKKMIDIRIQEIEHENSQNSVCGMLILPVYVNRISFSRDL